MGSSPPVVPNDGIRAQAERILAGPPSRGALALAFDESARLVRRCPRRGRVVLPADARGHRRRLVLGAHQPVRLPARPRRRPVRGRADREGRGGRPRQARRRPAGLRPGARARRPSTTASPLRGSRCASCARPSFASPTGPLATGGATRWNLRGLGHIDHRKLVVVDGRVGWVGGAGIEDHFQDGRFHDLFLRVEGPVVAQLQLVFVASFRWLGGEIDPAGARRAVSRPGRRGRAGARARPAQRARPLPADHRRDRARARRARPRRSTSSTRTSPTAG